MKREKESKTAVKQTATARLFVNPSLENPTEIISQPKSMHMYTQQRNMGKY